MIEGYELKHKHLYVGVRIKDVNVDIVPTFKIDDPTSVKAAMGRTLSRTRFIEKKLTDEIRFRPQWKCYRIMCNEVFFK